MAAHEATSQAWLEAARAGDWAAAAATYTEDAVLLPPNQATVVGRSNIQEALGAFPPITAIDLQVTEVEGRGDLAYVIGTYTMTVAPEGADPITDSGKYLEIRRKQADGSWLLTHDMYSSDLPLPSGGSEE
jgi:uncharacterized protein (TIGR02246 family)